MKKCLGAALCLIVLMALAPAASAGTLYAVQESNDTLISINTNTLAPTTIGALGITFEFGGLAWNSATQTLYMIGGRTSPALYTVNTATGAATLVGTHGVGDLFGLEYDPTTGTLYGSQFSGGTSLYSLNAASGAATLIGNMGRGIGGLAYNSVTNQLVGIEDGAGDLYTVNRSTAATTLLSNNPGNNDSGLAFDPDLNRYWYVDWSGWLVYINASTFAETRTAMGLGALDGLAYVTTSGPPPQVPEPGGMLLLAGGLAFLAWRRRASL